jgi:hypothetical protein
LGTTFKGAKLIQDWHVPVGNHRRRTGGYPTLAYRSSQLLLGQGRTEKAVEADLTRVGRGPSSSYGPDSWAVVSSSRNSPYVHVRAHCCIPPVHPCGVLVLHHRLRAVPGRSRVGPSRSDRCRTTTQRGSQRTRTLPTFRFRDRPHHPFTETASEAGRSFSSSVAGRKRIGVRSLLGRTRACNQSSAALQAASPASTDDRNPPGLRCALCSVHFAWHWHGPWQVGPISSNPLTLTS